MAMTRDWDHAGIAAKALERFGSKVHLKGLMHDIYNF